MEMGLTGENTGSGVEGEMLVKTETALEIFMKMQLGGYVCAVGFSFEIEMYVHNYK